MIKEILPRKFSRKGVGGILKIKFGSTRKYAVVTKKLSPIKISRYRGSLLEIKFDYTRE